MFFSLSLSYNVQWKQKMPTLAELSATTLKGIHDESGDTPRFQYPKMLMFVQIKM